MKNFEKFEHKQEQETVVSRFEDFRGKDLSEQNFSNVPIDVLQTIDFDTETIWPEREKLPKNFAPEKLLEESKNPGLGIKELHKQGITGQGVIVAIIDQKLDINHPEYKDSIVGYTEYDESEKEEVSMHGPAVASLLVGKDCGVAPGAKLVFKAAEVGKTFKERFKSYPKALNDIIKANEKLPIESKVKIVSCSIGYNDGGPENNVEYNIGEWIDALQKAKEAGIFVVDVGGNQIDISFTGGGSPDGKNDFESYLSWLYEGEGNEELNKIISEGNIDEILKKLREAKKDYLANISDIDLRKKIEERLNERKKEILVPSDYRTMASSWNKEGQYMYQGRGGISWSVPYLAGIFALILQVDPNIKREEIAEIINESAVVNEKGLRIVNPKGIIDLVKERMKS